MPKEKLIIELSEFLSAALWKNIVKKKWKGDKRGLKKCPLHSCKVAQHYYYYQGNIN